MWPALLLVLLVRATVSSAADVPALRRGHAHNDYEHPRPLQDALERGFGSVEADVWLVGGELRVAHDLADARPGRTLEMLYLRPLSRHVRQHGGRVHREGTPLILLVDIKSAAAATYAVLHAGLSRHAQMLTTFRRGGATKGAVTVVVSGNRARAEIAAQEVRYAAMDGRAGDLVANPPATLVPLVSENWKTVFNWNWAGAMPDTVQGQLARFVDTAHAQGRRVRFWNTPDRPEAWQLLWEAGVDLIGTDDLPGLQVFLSAKDARPR